MFSKQEIAEIPDKTWDAYVEARAEYEGWYETINRYKQKKI